MKTILIPTDFSENALHAARYGAALAHQLDAKVLLFHAFHLPEGIADGAIYIPTLKELTAQNIGQLEKVGRELKNQYPVHLEYAAKLGFFVDELTRLVESLPDCLVVMGMRGANLLEQKLLGTLTTSVLRQASFPVLVVPVEAEVQPIRRMLFACDYESLAVDNSLNWLKTIAHQYKAKVRVLHIAQPDTVLSDGSLAVEGAHLERMLRGVDHQFDWLEEENVSEGIEQGIKSTQADLLVMVPRKRPFWDIITGRSQTRKMAFKTSVPLLSLPNPVQN
jgi:nucleotide-binding universal stress UspA family protein